MTYIRGSQIIKEDDIKNLRTAKQFKDNKTNLFFLLIKLISTQLFFLFLFHLKLKHGLKSEV